MHNQLMIEKYKAERFIILYLAAAVLAAAGFFLGFLKLAEDLDTATVFSFTICDTSFLFIVSLVAAWFAGNDFLNRTIQNEIKAGYSRFSVFLARTIATVIMAQLLHLTYVFATVLGFSLKYRFDSSIFSVTDFVWLLVVMLQIGANICIVMFIVFALRKATSGIAVTVVFSFTELFRNRHLRHKKESQQINREHGAAEVKKLSEFFCPQNPDVEHFLKKSAVEFTKRVSR